METLKLLEMVELLDVKMGWINKSTHGSFNPKTHRIRLNVETMVVEVLVHEVMHMVHPMLCMEEDEEVIDTLTERVYKKLTTQQVRAMAKKLLRRQYA